MLNILILAAGKAQSKEREGDYPLCLTETDGVSVIEKILAKTVGLENASYTFAIQDADAHRFHLEKVMALLVPGSRVVRIPESTMGSACTALLAACQLSPENELLIVSANEIVNVDFNDVLKKFRQQQFEAGTVTFRSIHPRYSYVRLDTEGCVTEVAQQNPISHHATAGIFWYRRTDDFIDAAKNVIRKDAMVSGQFFVAPVFNELILKQQRIGVHEIGSDCYIPLKTESQRHQFESGGA